uniref:Protein SYS1 homolog n=1 Tax=Syphacia muris TaxID=451379 RepID=A0A0N5ACD3_9BILA
LTTQVLSELVCSVLLVRVIQRSRQCLDFVCTFHLFHLAFVVIYNGAFPLKILWWILQVLGIFICTVTGEHLCKKYESQEIQLSQLPSKYDL